MLVEVPALRQKVVDTGSRNPQASNETIEMTKPTRILRILVAGAGLALVISLTAWAFLAHLNPDRVGDFASFLQMCAAVLTR